MARKKTAQKAHRSDQLETVKTLMDLKVSLQERIEAYNQKIIEAPLTSGKELFDDFKTDPADTVTTLMADGRDRLRNLGKESWESLLTFLDDGKEAAKKIVSDPGKFIQEKVDTSSAYAEDKKKRTRKQIDTAVDEAQRFYSGLKKDADKLLDRYAKNRQEYREQILMLESFEKKITNRVRGMLKKMDLPDRGDIEKLAVALEAMNNKVDNLKGSTASTPLDLTNTN